MAAIRISGLTKRFPGRWQIPGVREGSPAQTAVRDLDLTVEEGEVFGFLGPNGAGKSTTINVLLDYVKPTAGAVEVFGVDAQADPKTIHNHVGVLPEGFELWDRLPARNHVLLAADAKGVEVDPATILERVGLGDAIDRPVGGFSTGMAQRLALGMALVGEPDLLILDEPTAGLDPNGVRRLREIVDEEVKRGATVFFSSHVLEQVEAVADKVAILRDGELVAVDSIEGLRQEAGLGETLTVELTDGNVDATTAVEPVEGVTAVTQDGTTVTATCRSGPAKGGAIEAILETGTSLRDVDVESTDLESLFANYAGSGDEGSPAATGENADRSRDEPDESVDETVEVHS